MKTQISGMTHEQKLNFFNGHKILTTYVQGPRGKGHLPICRDEVLWHEPVATPGEALNRGKSYMAALIQNAKQAAPITKELRRA